MPALHLSTILTREPSRLLAHVGDIARRYGGQGHTVLFTLSSNFQEPKDLQAAVNRLNKFNDIDSTQPCTNEGKAAGHTVGCLSDTFSSVKFEKFPQLTSSNDDLLSCSIGVFNSDTCIPFRSTLPSRIQPQVGRWHSFRKKSDASSSSLDEGDWEPDWQNVEAGKGNAKGNDEVDWEAIWNRSSNATGTKAAEILPETLQDIERSRIQALFSLSSSHPDALTNALANRLPEPPSLTVIAAPTHFITGRGVTLFMDGQIYDDGAVGVALLRDAHASGQQVHRRPTPSTSFFGMTPLSEPMVVTRREGNVINELNSSNPTQLLLRSLDNSQGLSARPTFKDAEQFALGTVGADGQIVRTYRITAGDPSSRGGSISLDAPTAPAEGSVVQFLHISGNSSINIPASLFLSGSDKPSEKVLACVSVPEALTSASLHTPTEASEPSTHIMEDAFLVPSTQGFVLSDSSTSARPGTLSTTSNSPWTSSLPGSAVLLPVY